MSADRFVVVDQWDDLIADLGADAVAFLTARGLGLVLESGAALAGRLARALADHAPDLLRNVAALLPSASVEGAMSAPGARLSLFVAPGELFASILGGVLRDEKGFAAQADIAAVVDRYSPGAFPRTPEPSWVDLSACAPRWRPLVAAVYHAGHDMIPFCIEGPALGLAVLRSEQAPAQLAELVEQHVAPLRLHVPLFREAVVPGGVSQVTAVEAAPHERELVVLGLDRPAYDALSTRRVHGFVSVQPARRVSALEAAMRRERDRRPAAPTLPAGARRRAS